MKKRALFFCLMLLIGIVAVASASATVKIRFDSTATMRLPDSFSYHSTQNNFRYYKDAKNAVTCGYRVTEGQVALKDVKATLKKSGYKSVKIVKVNGTEMCSGSKKTNGKTTSMSYFNTKDGRFVMLAFTYDASKSKAKKIVTAAVNSVKVVTPTPAPAAPAFSWTGLNGAVSSATYGGKDLVMIYLLYSDGGSAANDYIAYYLNRIKPSVAKLNKKEVQVLVCLLEAGDEELKTYAGKYKEMVFGRLDEAGDNEMWESLERLGYAGKTVSFPVVMLRSRNNRLRYYDTGSLENAATVVKKAIAMANDNVIAVPPDPDEVPDTTDDTIIAENGKYRISGSNAVFIGVKDTGVTELEIPTMISYDGVSYPVTEVASKACMGLAGLKTLKIDSNVEKIGSSAFRGCGKLKTIIIRTTKLTEGRIGTKAFYGIADKPTVKCPSSVMANYKKWLKEKGVPENAAFKSIVVK